MRLRLAHYRNRFSMFRTYYALRAGLVKTDGLEFTIVEVPDPPSRELEGGLPSLVRDVHCGLMAQEELDSAHLSRRSCLH